MNEKDKIRVEHILDSINRIYRFLENVSRDEFLENDLVQSAVVRQFEIIGEAASHVSDEIQEKYANIPWRIIKDFRNVLSHQYFGVDYNEVYTVYEKELDSLRILIREILQ